MPRDLAEQLLRDEGLSLKPYHDSKGKLTIGIGRNLDAEGITKQEADFLLANDIAKFEGLIKAALPWSLRLDLCRTAVLTNMAFNMGIAGLLGFKKMLGAAQKGDYELAAKEMLDSKWATEVGSRADRLAAQMRTGNWF